MEWPWDPIRSFHPPLGHFLGLKRILFWSRGTDPFCLKSSRFWQEELPLLCDDETHQARKSSKKLWILDQLSYLSYKMTSPFLTVNHGPVLISKLGSATMRSCEVSSLTNKRAKDLIWHSSRPCAFLIQSKSATAYTPGVSSSLSWPRYSTTRIANPRFAISGLRNSEKWDERTHVTKAVVSRSTNLDLKEQLGLLSCITHKVWLRYWESFNPYMVCVYWASSALASLRSLSHREWMFAVENRSLLLNLSIMVTSNVYRNQENRTIWKKRHLKLQVTAACPRSCNTPWGHKLLPTHIFEGLKLIWTSLKLALDFARSNGSSNQCQLDQYSRCARLLAELYVWEL